MADEALEGLAREVGARLLHARWLLVTAESCTGGWVAQVVTSIAGSSAWFERGFVTYSNDAKRELLGVDEDTLGTHGAVSEPTACAMARGALARSRGHIAVAVTGIAGPSGGTSAKPVGMVCFAWAVLAEATSMTHRLSGDREAVRRQSVMIALEGVRDRIR